MTTHTTYPITLPLLIAAGIVFQAAGWVATHPDAPKTETAVVALTPYAPIVKSEDRVLPDEVLPTEAIIPVEEPVHAPAVVKTKHRRHHHHSQRNHDAPELIVGVTNPVSHNEEETMHPTRAYCTRLGNHKIGSPLNRVCFERDMITGKIYKIPN